LENINLEQWKYIHEKMDESQTSKEKHPLIIDIKDPPKKEDEEESKED
jgi:hypothetical protein